MTVATDFAVSLLDAPTPALIEFLESVRFGGDGLRYQRVAVADAIDALGNAHWLALRKAGRIGGSYMLSEAPARLDDGTVNASYRGLLAVDASLRRRGYGKALVESAFEHLEQRAGQAPLLSFGLIERSNTASRRLLETLGGQTVGALESRLVYRQWPGPSSNLIRLDDARLADYMQRLGARSTGLTLSAPATLPAWGLLRDDQLVAAARVSHSAIDLGEGGPLARLLHRYAYSRIRAIGKRYNRRAFTWLGIHDPLVEADPADAWPEFISALLAAHDRHMALFTLDEAGQPARLLQDAGVFGRFADATRQELRLVASGWNLPAGWEERTRATPILGGPVF